MEVLFDAFVHPLCGDLSLCSTRNKALADGIGMEFNDAVKHIEQILQHSIIVGHDMFQDLDIFPTSDGIFKAIYDTSECKALQEQAGLPVKPGEKLSLKNLAKALLRKDIQTGRHHNPCEDAYVSLQLFLQHRQLFEETLRKPNFTCFINRTPSLRAETC